MKYTVLPITSLDPITFGAEYLALDDAASETWKKNIQALHPKLLPQLKENSLLAEEDSPFCVAGGVFDYERGRELVFDGERFVLSHCAEHFLDFLQPSADCLQIVEEKADSFEKCNSTEEDRARFVILKNWWQQGYHAFILQHN
ncbi:hypothetical protein JJB07_05620 [Tumebacillus sp. ITR2]|uniref:Uncharacterized protein n=1 Tax=Tumebacillus amylolyticus TaxID=2801339 RepID=A0ABS1J905_9BACL|nr:hypothetical protein [Tumebacillus amylolyticus]MBL0386128.1 hypothetical protein [Tumebacillus amylolyticus]